MLSRFHDAGQDSSPLRGRKLHETSPLRNEDVKSKVYVPRLGGAKVLQQMKIRPAAGAQGYHLFVDDRLIRQMLALRRDVRGLPGEHFLAPRIKSGRPALAYYLKPIAIEFDS